jgi:DNA-binding transcriptional MocR family regulator
VPDLGTLRLSFAAPDVVQIQEGIERLAKAFAQAS